MICTGVEITEAKIGRGLPDNFQGPGGADKRVAGAKLSPELIGSSGAVVIENKIYDLPRDARTQIDRLGATVHGDGVIAVARPDAERDQLGTIRAAPRCSLGRFQVYAGESHRVADIETH